MSFLDFNTMLTKVKKGIKRAFGQGAVGAISGLWREARDSALFNPVWYEETNNKKFDSHKAAFEDYVRVSKFAPVNPSPFFDTETYHRQYLDVYHGSESPLLHYLAHGREEGRAYQPVVPRWSPKHVQQYDAKLSSAAGQLTIAVCLHVFYEDFIEKFANALRNFPVKIDLYVAVAKTDWVSEAQRAFSENANVGKVEVIVGQNRGRNFGPLLVEFSDSVLDYDLVCHLHSKKSLYSGREQTQWADYLCEYLLSDPSVIAGALNLFASDSSIGIYHPTTFWMMPAWTNHQTMNVSNLKQWEKSLGLSGCSGFMSYPAGGMFWARPKALAQLLKRDWKYEDFPEEPLPNDGSMLHGLERVIGKLAESNGYKQLFYYPTLAKFTLDQSYIGASYYTSLEQHIGAIRAHECISFDVFDTLVRRKYFFPDYAKLRLGKELVEQQLVASAVDFVELRNKTEFEVRKTQDFKGDVSIFEVYEALIEPLGIERVRAERLASREFELDLEMILPREDVVALFNALGDDGYKLWIISDSYYTPEQVALMLKKAGITAPFKLMVSSSEQRRKDNGTMWPKVKADLASDGVSRYIHIGDNVVSDAQVPGDFGLATFHVLNPLEKWKLMGFSVAWDSSLPSEEDILKWGKLVSSNGSTVFIGG